MIHYTFYIIYVEKTYMGKLNVITCADFLNEFGTCSKLNNNRSK